MKDEFKVNWISPNSQNTGKNWEAVKQIIKAFLISGQPILTVQFDTPDTLELRKRIEELEAKLKGQDNPTIFIDEMGDWK